MLTVFGLGNPGPAYKKTRHNVGFMLLDGIFDGRYIQKATFHQSGLGIFKSFSDSGRKFRRNNGLFVNVVGEISGKRFLFVKPTTFMNESGKAIASLVTRGILKNLAELLVVVDDVDLITGSLRLREKGSAGGHNGLKSIIKHLGSSEFPRLRIGVGPRPGGEEIVEYVLGTFRPEEFEPLEKSLNNASGIVEAWIDGGFESANVLLSQINSNNN